MSQSRRERRKNDRLKQKFIDMAKLTGGPVIDVQDDFVTHYGPNGATTINWLAPTLLSKIIKDGKMELELLWGGQVAGGNQIQPSNIAKSIIGRGKTGKFVYQSYLDNTPFTTVWDDVDRLLWEYEIPRELKQEILNLPISDVKEKAFIDFEQFLQYHKSMAHHIHNNNF